MDKIYEDALIETKLRGASAAARVAFSAGVAELLFRLAFRRSETVGSASAWELRRLLDLVWAGIDKASSLTRDDIELALSQYPDDEAEGWELDFGYAQNAAGAVAYAIEVQVVGEPQSAVWAARQLREAAEYAVEMSAELDDSYVHEADQILFDLLDAAGRSQVAVRARLDAADLHAWVSRAP